ncbi:hypothetical protein [Mesorhizobium sp.]|uniref:hypothetical protein n=2 Tax=unclassified Mesorhizobium TaxID=325217 RepID=UPI00257993F0|nr:hypothetical protein [Mesorhizobium sp.]
MDDDNQRRAASAARRKGDISGQRQTIPRLYRYGQHWPQRHAFKIVPLGEELKRAPPASIEHAQLCGRVARLEADHHAPSAGADAHDHQIEAGSVLKLPREVGGECLIDRMPAASCGEGCCGKRPARIGIVDDFRDIGLAVSSQNRRYYSSCIDRDEGSAIAAARIEQEHHLTVGTQAIYMRGQGILCRDFKKGNPLSIPLSLEDFDRPVLPHPLAKAHSEAGVGMQPAETGILEHGHPPTGRYVGPNEVKALPIPVINTEQDVGRNTSRGAIEERSRTAIRRQRDLRSRVHVDAERLIVLITGRIAKDDDMPSVRRPKQRRRNGADRSAGQASGGSCIKGLRYHYAQHPGFVLEPSDPGAIVAQSQMRSERIGERDLSRQ